LTDLKWEVPVEFLVGLLQNVLASLVTQAISYVPGLVSSKVKEATKGMKSDELQRLLQALGATSPHSIRALVQQVFGKEARISPQQREDVAAVLISLTRGANLLNSQGDPRSVYVRAEDLLQRLLDQLQPKRRAGEKVFPNYPWVLVRFLGMGAFGEVWLAYNARAPRLPKRAYKFFTHEGAVEWLNREKDRLLEVEEKLKHHPQIVRLIDVGMPKEGDPYLELEYVEGGSLEDWIMDPERGKRPLRKGEVMRGIVRAMAAAHRQQVYHRDIKPANILLTRPPDVQPKITDFGLGCAEATDQGEAESGEVDLMLAGTPMYWPPEAFRPFAARTPALYDVFALGVLWYQLLVERMDRPSYDFAAELRERGEDSHTIQLISRCLARPERRFPDAGELNNHMEQADLPVWEPVPEGLFDVQHLVREYVGIASK
jgi:serine/threonine protein kinase